MKHLSRFLLLLGIILGLAGQGAAFAAAPCSTMRVEPVSAMSESMAGMPDCEMGQHEGHESPVPCKDMAAGCLAMSGCTALIAFDSLTPTADAPLIVTALELWPSVSVLRGRTIAPEPDPPSLLV